MESMTNDESQISLVEFYWRPGCPFCLHLERALDTAKIPMSKRNIWDDPDAAAFVRSVADGNETVPTVRVGAWSGVNPSPAEVAKALAIEAPHLLPQS
jgi:mycoredoxin